MRALGVHTYFGGFALGVAEKAEVLTSMESWKWGIEGRRCGCAYTGAMRYTELMDGKVPKADLVFANPPCSRFSNTAQHTFSDDSKRDVSKFSELGEVIDVADAAGASVIWWETGPQLWSKGRDMVKSAHALLTSRWGACTTFLTWFDLRYAGVPQRRPRCHVIHLAGWFYPPQSHPPPAWPPPKTLGPWIDEQLDRYEYTSDRSLHVPVMPVDTFGSALRTAVITRDISNFGQNMPVIVSRKDAYSLAVLSGRTCAWLEENRWVSIEEWSTLMSIPPKIARAAADKLGTLRTLSLLSKGVSARAATFVYETVLSPTLRNGRRKNVGRISPAFKSWGEGDDWLWEARLWISDSRPRRTSLVQDDIEAPAE